MNCLLSRIQYVIKNNSYILYLSCLTIFILTSLLMYVRVFWGTEILDESFYIAEAKEILNGSFVPYSYNNWFSAIGFTFLLLPIEFIYSLISPSFEGIVLFTRICFVSFKVFIAICVFRIFSHSISKSTSLLLASVLIPMTLLIQNFSYNTVPELTLFLSALIVYDVIENEAKKRIFKLLVAGVLTAIGCFANPGWGFCFIILSILILSRSLDKQKKINIFCYLIPIFLFTAFIVSYISLVTNFSDLCYGLYRLFIARFPTESLDPAKSYFEIFKALLEPVSMVLFILFSCCLALKSFANNYVFFSGKKLLAKQLVEFSYVSAFFLIIVLFSFKYKASGDQFIMEVGLTSFLFAVFMIFCKELKDEKILLYLCLFQPFYAVLVSILEDQGAGIGRFVNAFTLVIPVLYVLSKSTFTPVRYIVNIIALVIISTCVYTSYKYVYMDSNIRSLTHRVSSGVYKGLYTTERRAEDLPNLEKYLNSIIDGNECYAFRDNAPLAYLVTHKKNVCDLSTWDVLQYHYHLNSPALLYDYYRNSKRFPEKIIYLDFGRDNNLSIDDDSFKYNLWVKSYYRLIEDNYINQTFFRVKVYKYMGNFDGNFQKWIDSVKK